MKSLHRYIDTNMQNKTCVGKMIPTYNKQHLSNSWGSIHYKVKLYRGWAGKMPK